MMPEPHAAGSTRLDSDVTIVISSYNQAEYLGEAVASALAQTVPCRVVVVDDGSADGSADLAVGLGVETVRLPHQGALETFRAAVDLVTTPFYCLLNGDDVIEPTYVERTRPEMAGARVGFVYTGVRLFGEMEGMLPARPFDAGALRWSNFAHGASLVRTDAYRSVGGFDPAFEDHHEDWALWVAMVAQGWTGAPVDEPLLRYRQRAGSRTPRHPFEFERARWRIARRHLCFYGPYGFARLLGSAAKRRVSNLASMGAVGSSSTL